VKMLCKIPGRRLFQYRNGDGVVRTVTAREVNAFLREIAGVKISLKDFRTLLASAAVLETLARQAPAASVRARRRQVLEAVREVAEDLHNTPTVCRRSYVHDTVVSAFEDGVLESFADVLKNNRSALRREQLLAKVVAIASDSAQGKAPGEGPA
jgi:DNA topoisomerase-1